MGHFGFPFGGDCGIVTLFSGPNDCGNKGSVIRVNPLLMCSFPVLDPINCQERPGDTPVQR
jgi:hypothetical protein